MIESFSDYVIDQVHGTWSISHLKLQKLLYYIKAWGLVAGIETFPEDFRRWEYGPVNDRIYSKYKGFGDKELESPEASKPPETDLEFVGFVLRQYAPLSAWSLSSMTHAEDPWKLTPSQETIQTSLMKEYYAGLPFAKNFPLGTSAPFIALSTVADSAYFLDMDEEVKNAAMTFAKESEFEEMSKRTLLRISQQANNWKSRVPNP